MPDRGRNFPDRRLLFWMDLEDEIQKRAPRKDPNFSVTEPSCRSWKKFVKEEDGFKIFAVNGEKVRNNLSVMFGHGGHGYVHEFIPLNELWIDTHHYTCLGGCGCDNLKRKNQRVSPEYFESTVIHEKNEFWAMARGKNFYQADQIARQEEARAGLLPDPDSEIDLEQPEAV